MNILKIAAAALALCATGHAQAGIYKCKTLGGRLIISDRPCTQEELGKENLKLATPVPEAAKPPETSPHDETFSKGSATDGKAATVEAPPEPAEEVAGVPRARKPRTGIERQQEAERQSGIDSK